MSEKRFLYRNFLEEEVEKRFTKEYDEKWGIYLSDNLTRDWYNINPVHIVDTCNNLWEQVVKLIEENEQLRQTNEKLEQECRQHLATNLRLLEQLNDFEEKISDKKLFKQKVTCDYKGDYVR